MRYTLFIIVLLLSECGYKLPTSYQYVEDNKVRPIAFVIDNQGFAEAAPRDTITLRSYFGGENVNDIDFHFSFSNSSTDSSDDISMIIPGSTKLYSNGSTDSVICNLKIPDSVIINAFKSATSLRALLPSDTHDSIPAAVLDKKPIEVITILEELAYSSNASQNIALNTLASLSPNANISAGRYLPVLLQVFTVPITIHATVNNKYKVKSSISIRYNTRLRYMGSIVPTNRNPDIIQISIYKVKGDCKSFDPYTNSTLIDTFYNFSNTQRIFFTPGFSYFLMAHRNHQITDSGITMNFTKGREDFTYEWFYYNNSTTATSSDSLCILDNWPPNSYMIRLLPPLSKAQKHLTIWLVSYDYYIGERLRPVGFALKQADVEIEN